MIFAFIQHPDDLRRIAAHNAVCGHILCNHGARGEYGVISHRYARQDRHIGSDPDVIADAHRLAAQDAALFQIVVICHDRDMRADLDPVAEIDAANGHGCKAVVEKHMLTEVHLLGKVDLYRGKQAESFRRLAAEEFIQCLPLFLAQRFRRVQAVQRLIAAVQLLDRRTVLRCVHVHGLAAFELFKDVHTNLPQKFLCSFICSISVSLIFHNGQISCFRYLGNGFVKSVA